MRVPPDVRQFDSGGRPLVCKLRRSLYGLKQAGREWAMLFSEFLIAWGFTRSAVDPCLYVFADGSYILWVLIYVDDGLLLDNHSPLRKRFVDDLSARFPTEDKGELEWMLNVSIARDRPNRTIVLSQQLYINDLVAKFGHLADAELVRRFDTPMEDGLILSSDDQPAIDSSEYVAMATKRESYMSMVGGYLWLTNMTLWFLAYPAGQLARFLTNPGESHYRAALRVLVFLRDSGPHDLVLSSCDTKGLDVYVDSNWAVKFSVSGCLVFFRGCLIHWFSKMQKSVSLSSAEAEFYGAMMTARDLVWIRELLVDFDLALSEAITIWSDSKSAVDMSFDPVAFKQTKHIMRCAEFLRVTLCPARL